MVRTRQVVGTAPVRDDMEIDGGREDHIWEDGTHKPVSDDMVWDPETGQEVPASDKEASVSGGVGPNPENPGLSQDSNRVEGCARHGRRIGSSGPLPRLTVPSPR